jgi:GDPmannose 4,6-dehydratase
MNTAKTALITGITGQDGSYLADFLVDKGYRVYGMVRRTSSENLWRVHHLHDKIRLVFGDLLDQNSLITALQESQADEVYNLAAQSFVPTSWNQPVLTGEFTALGVTRMLEAIRVINPKVRFYQASSSEMFGKVREIPQKETTPFYPRSPYGVAKCYGHFLTVNYRESYGIYACSGILFNHECLDATTPLIVRRAGSVDVVTPDELIPLRRKGPSQQTFDLTDVEIWDGTRWSRLLSVTATWRRTTDPTHRVLAVQARGGVVNVTAHHHMIGADGEVVVADNVSEGDHLRLCETFPDTPAWTVMTVEMAELLGLLTAEGFVSEDGAVQFTNNDPLLRDRAALLWSKLFLGSSTTRFYPSGWNANREVGQLYLRGDRAIGRWLREQLYAGEGLKRVPRLVLNASHEIQQAFIDGYYAGDGLQAGNGESVKTSSPLLAQGLCWLYANVGRQSSVYLEQRGEASYYQLNIGAGEHVGGNGQHLRKPAAEVRAVRAAAAPSEWVFDLETETGVLCAGVGRLVVHNSPRRGLEFVTRKITYGVASIKHGLQDKLRLGNLDAGRDWGYAADYVTAMWAMLQQNEPDDYVVATGETHSVREFAERAFARVGLDWQRHVEVDDALMRPAEVDLLVGDASKARTVLAWQPTVTFEGLVNLMVDADVALVGDEVRSGAGTKPRLTSIR